MKTTIDLKKLVMTVALALSGIAFSQVGINNTDPKATLDVTAKTTDASKPEGIIAPRLTGDQIRGKNAQYTADQTGTIVYATSADTAPAGKTASITAAGYYYFDGSVWQKVGGISGSYDKTDDAWVNDNTNTMVKLGTQSDGSTTRTAGTELVAKDNGYVGIGNTSPNDKLHIVTSENNKGISVTNSTTTAGTVTRFGIGGGNPVWGALNYTNIDNSSSRISVGTYDGSEYLTVGVGGSKAGKVGIGTTSPDVSSILDVSSTNKGFLPPRVTLTSDTDGTTIATPATGLTVYHTGNAALDAGLYTNVGTPSSPKWNSNTGDGSISDDSGSEIKKIQYRGNYGTKTVINGPFEFRISGSGNSGTFTYQFRLISAPVDSVDVSVAGIIGMGGVGLTSGNATNTFTTANWNTWQDIKSITVSKNGHITYLSVDTTNITNYDIPIFYCIYAQRVDGSGGLKSMIVTRY